MSNDLKFIAVIMLGIALIVAVITCSVAIQSYLFVKGGYVECALPGSTGGHWCK